MITRREGLGLALAAGALAFTPRALAAEGPSLQTLAKAKGLRFGSAVAANAGGGIKNPRYAALLEAECGVLVAENEMKWQSIRPGPRSFDFAAFDSIMDYAARHNLAMRGHTLLWHRTKWMPSWLADYDFGTSPVVEAEKLVRAHIETVVPRYRDRIHSFDVVNETVMEDGTLAETAISKAMGGTEALVDFAFHTARAAAPDAELVYNDYMSWEPGNEAHRAGVLKLLEGLKKRGTPVDALGVQSHLIAGPAHKPQEREWRAFIDAVTAMGYGLVITEFDVRDGALPKSARPRDAAIASLTSAYLDMMLSYKSLKDLLVWGMCDSFSWLQSFEPRKDKTPVRGNPYDVAYRAKPMREAIARSLMAAAPR
jgi:endo-1,4-beta-xylanase